MRLRRRREKPKAAPAPRRGSGAGTFCVNSVVKADNLRPPEAVKFCETAVVFVPLTNVLRSGAEIALVVKGEPITPEMVEVTFGLLAVTPPLPLTFTATVSKVATGSVMAMLYINVPLTVPVVAGLKSVWMVHTPRYSEILIVPLPVKPARLKPEKVLSPTTPLQEERLLKVHERSALASPALINAAAERKRAAPVRERLIPGFSLKLTKGEFMVG